MRRFHISIAVEDFDASMHEYTSKLACAPQVFLQGRYALWRTPGLNFSISKKAGEKAGTVRHIGFEDESEAGFREETDCNGLVWEFFNWHGQQQEIREKFPTAVWTQ